MEETTSLHFPGQFPWLTGEKAEVPDLGAVFDAAVRHEFEDKDVDATMKTMVAEPYVHNVPTLTGGEGRSHQLLPQSLRRQDAPRHKGGKGFTQGR